MTLMAPLVGKADQPARDRINGIVDITAGKRDGHWLSGLEELELDIKPGLSKISALKGHEISGMRGEAQRPHLDFLFHCQRRGGQSACRGCPP